LFSGVEADVYSIQERCLVVVQINIRAARLKC